MIKAALFDLDGTLINTNALVIESFKYTLKKCLALEAKEEDLVNYFGEPLFTTLERYDKENVDTLLKVYREFNEENHDILACEIVEAVETLIELKRMGIKVAVVTSKRKAMAHRGLKLFGLMDYIDEIITPESTEKHKPHGEPALKACEMLKVNPKEAVMVGDSHFDILCGKNAGCFTCVVEYTALPLDEILKYKPDYRISSLKDIIKIIE